MSRRRRIHYPHACYHVMLRGNYRQAIFNRDEDYLLFYSLLEEATKKYNLNVHLFCLMTNHIHLLLEVDYIPLAKVMQYISSKFTAYSNKVNNRTGHLFQGRYNAIIVQSAPYFLELCQYIHNNPLKAKMVKKTRPISMEQPSSLYSAKVHTLVDHTSNH